MIANKFSLVLFLVLAVYFASECIEVANASGAKHSLLGLNLATEETAENQDNVETVNLLTNHHVLNAV
ncbi:hypothetical protein Ocin01_03455 [Orchesella cincta]|uniref:Uncharacterized protein n=1 Tax=Orchesella cincta TaxID=48709 RepID=A0A1D2NE21_ORCCI|nr:hypothetical protein Ocin01_03455 [Orchesella cincta]